MFSTITAVATSILDPVRRVAFAVAVEDENGKLVHFNSNATVASRHTRVTTGLLEAICEGIGHLSKDTQKVVIRLSSPRIGNSQSSAARLLIRRSIPGPKGANHQRQWAEIQGLLAGRIVTWKPVDFNSDDQLCALERTCLHCLEAPLGFPKHEDSAQAQRTERHATSPGALSRCAHVGAASIVLGSVRACAELEFVHVA